MDIQMIVILMNDVHLCLIQDNLIAFKRKFFYLLVGKNLQLNTLSLDGLIFGSIFLKHPAFVIAIASAKSRSTLNKKSSKDLKSLEIRSFIITSIACFFTFLMLIKPIRIFCL